MQCPVKSIVIFTVYIVKVVSFVSERFYCIIFRFLFCVFLWTIVYLYLFSYYNCMFIYNVCV